MATFLCLERKKVFFINKNKFVIICFSLVLGMQFLGCNVNRHSKDNQPSENEADLSSTIEKSSISREDKIEGQIKTFNLKEYTESGEKKWEVKASVAEIYEDIINLADVAGVAYGSANPDGEKLKVNIKSKQGKYDKKSQDIYLFDDVIATTSDGITMMTDKLKWEAKREQAYTDSKVVVKNNKIKIQGEGAWAKPNLKKLKFEDDIITNVEPDTIILCDGPLEVDYKDNFAIFKKNVVVKDKRGKMWADKMTVYFDDKREIRKIVAEGDVKIKRGKDVTLSKKAEYIAKENKVILTGRPKLLIYPEDRRQKSEDRRQKSEGRSQKTEDRKQKTENRKQKSEKQETEGPLR